VGGQAAAGVQDHRFGGPVQHVAAERAEAGVGQGQHGQPHQRLGHRPVVGEVVDQPLGGQRQGQADRAGGEAEQAPYDEGEAVGPGVGEQDPPGRRLGRLLIVP
jgi:hypothetical protein